MRLITIKVVSIEIHDGVTGSNESFLKFRTNPSQLDIKTSKFFLGKESNPRTLLVVQMVTYKYLLQILN